MTNFILRVRDTTRVKARDIIIEKVYQSHNIISDMMTFSSSEIYYCVLGEIIRS